MRTSVRQAGGLRALLIAGLVFVPLVGLQLSCSGLGLSSARRQISWSELSTQAGGAKGAVQLASGDILATHMAWQSGAVAVVCSRSTDGGKHWGDISVVARSGSP